MSGAIVTHSVQLVRRNIGEALRVSLVPLAVATVLIGLITAFFGPEVPLQPGTEEAPAPADLAATLIVLAVTVTVGILCAAWAAVAWHRFVLLEEYPGWIPPFAGRPVGAYALRSFQLSLVVIAIMVPISLVFALIATLLPFVFLVFLAIFFAASYLSLRFGLILPATAVGETMSLRAAWAASASASNGIAVAAVVLAALQIVLALAVQGLALAGLGILAFAADIVVNWLSLMLGIAVLTTIYGVTVEGRRLG
ncbi:hypothetical protein [Pseudoroseicyclus aestuarii]|uniref:DUF4013 domain-containing protein n=1 Tax=Pseudoroseicyclus aestuarii TaxID=1795041 RepID=A0A318T7V4_9RHOB|nr:hypothetical protein [Pseudoroseicyclus aestuarii]PYE84478.1 hypothetical protein DFP88_102278 [Pseudoroseicyclus aestuarii]